MMRVCEGERRQMMGIYAVAREMNNRFPGIFYV